MCRTSRHLVRLRRVDVSGDVVWVTVRIHKLPIARDARRNAGQRLCSPTTPFAHICTRIREASPHRHRFSPRASDILISSNVSTLGTSGSEIDRGGRKTDGSVIKRTKPNRFGQEKPRFTSYTAKRHEDAISHKTASFPTRQSQNDVIATQSRASLISR